MFAISRADWLLQASQALQFFARLETHRFAGGDIHFFAGARIAANAGLARLHGKNSEAAQFNSLAAAHAAFQRFKNRLDGLLGLDAAHPGPIELGQYGVHDIQFNQRSSPLRASNRARFV
jgi:hypothetical protein